MELDVWNGNWGLPSIDYSSLQLIALVKLADVEATVNKVENPFRILNGNVPLFRHKERRFHRFQDVLNSLNEEKRSPDLNLTEKQLAESIAYRVMVEEELYPALKYIWWIDRKNFNEVTKPCYARMLPFPLNFFYPGNIRKNHENLLEYLYPDTDEMQSQIEIFKRAEKCLTCLSLRLGDEDYFFGRHPSSLDAFMYGCLAPLLKAPFPSSVFQNHLKVNTNLVKFIDRITRRYFLKELKEYEDTKFKNENQSSTTDIIPHKLRRQILAVSFALISMLTFGISTGLFSFTLKEPAEEIEDYDEDELEE